MLVFFLQGWCNERSMKYQLLVSGSPDAQKTPQSIYEKATAVGEAISLAGQTLLVDEMHGVSYQAAHGARGTKKHTAIIGFSPASNRYEHCTTYRLPVEEFTALHFTGGEYVGRTTLAARSADGLIVVGGEMATLQQVAAAIELGKVCGVLTGSGGVADMTPQILEQLAPRQRTLLITDNNPARLVKKMVAAIEARYS